MAYQPNSAKNPAAEYLFKLQLIVSNAEFKNNDEAARYEDMDTKLAGQQYVRAELSNDNFASYTYDPKHVYDVLLDVGVPEDRIYVMLNNMTMIPPKAKAILLHEARTNLTSNYVENNKYYCNLAGIPFAGYKNTPADTIVTIPDEFYDIYRDDGVIQKNQPIHTLPKKYMELFINSKFYDDILKQFPDVEYLKHIGSNSVPITISRKTYDGELMLINTGKLYAHHPVFGNVTVANDIIHLFSNVYKKTRDYVYNTLRGDFAKIYPNYSNFIRFLTIYMAMGQSLNELMRKSQSMSFMNNTTANNYFMLYGLPSVIMEGKSMISFLKKLRMLLMDKGTNIVYRVKDYVGYKYTDIFSLIMVKQQVFENGYPKYTYDAEGNPTPVSRIVFRRLGTTEDNTSYFKFRDSNVEYPWYEIASGDPRWWNTPEVERMLYDMNYTLSNSKYIQLSTHMSMSDIYWQTIILLRALLDSKKETQFSKINVNYDIGIDSDITVFDAVLVLVTLMNWQTTLVNGKTMSGELLSVNGSYNGIAACIDMLFNGLMDDGLTPNDLKPGKPFKIASFNFDIRNNDPDFYQSLYDFDYLEPDVFMNMLDKVLNNESKSVGELVMTDARAVYDYLKKKLVESYTIHQFRQVTDAFNHIFLVDPVRDAWFDEVTKNVQATILEMYNIAYYDYESLVRFCVDNNITVTVPYNDREYDINLGIVMRDNAENYAIDLYYPFRDSNFVKAFTSTMETFTSTQIQMSNLSNAVKLQYQDIIIDKVLLDIGNSSSGPKTFDALLYQHNTPLYRRLIMMRNDGSNLVMLMRAIVKALEEYSSSDLSALMFSAIGHDEYINILKEIIGYFKSYMVEYTKEEFVYVMDGLFDNGGNSNMLRLYDEITHMDLDLHVTDSLTLYDVSDSNLDQLYGNIDDPNIMYDEAIIRAQAKYSYIRNLGYDIWFDDGNRITKNKPDEVTDDTELVVNLIPDQSSYKIIIPIENIKK